MKILDLIKRACKNKDVDVKHAARIEKMMKVTKAEDVETAIDKFKEDILPGIEEVEKEARTDAEKDAKAKAEEEAVKAFREKHGLDEHGKPISNPDPKPDGDEPEWFKSYREKKDKEMEDLKSEFKTSKTDAEKATRKADAAKLIGTAKLPEGWLGRIDLDSDTSVEDQVKTLEDEYTEIQQSAINAKVESGEFSPGFRQPKERSEEEWTKLMNETEESSDPGVVDLGVK